MKPDKHNFLRYKSLKTKFNVSYKGYDLQNLIAHDIARFTFNKKFPKIKSVSRFFVIPDYNFFIKILSNNHIVFSILYHKRSDHRQLVESVRNEIKQATALLDYSKNKKSKIILSIKNISSSVKEVYENRKILGFKEMLYYSASLTY